MLSQSISVIDRSGKVVKSSQSIVSVFKEAKAAYLARRAEIKSSKEKDIRQSLENFSLNDGQPRNVHRRAPSPDSSRRRGAPPISRSRTYHNGHDDSVPPPLNRGFTDTAFANDAIYAPQPPYVDPMHYPNNTASQNNNQYTYPDPHYYPPPPSYQTQFSPSYGDLGPPTQLMRRSTEPVRPSSSESYDEDLAYGELPPRDIATEVQLQGKVSALNRVLMEADCLQYTATAMIDHLQKNPDKLAAVGMALAEISTLATKAAPGALAGLKTAFPAAMALILSPEFLIAGGLAVGVTVVMLGGYKIIQKINQNKKASAEKSEREGERLQMIEIQSEVGRIENWRRGVADSTVDAGTIDEYLITPAAHKRMVRQGKLSPSSVKPKVRARRSNSVHEGRRRATTDEAGPSREERPRPRRAGSVAESRISIEERPRPRRAESVAESRLSTNRRSRTFDEESMRSGSHRSTRSVARSHTSRSAKTNAKKSTGGLKMLFGGSNDKRRKSTGT